MTSPHRLKFVLLLICCMQHALASNSTSTLSANVSTISNGASMTATKKASATATVVPTSTIHDTTTSSSADVNTASAPVITSSSVSTIRNASISIGYSSPDCTSCSNGGTITVTMSCRIKMPPNDDKECDKAEFNKTSCGYVTMVDKVYWCADVKKNFTYYEKKHINLVKQCDDVCPASGSVMSAHLVFIFSSGLAVGLLSQTL